MKTISIFSNIHQAGVVQAWLAINEIDSFIPEEDTIGMLPFMAASSGIHLQVADEDFKRAEELVKEFFNEERNEERNFSETVAPQRQIFSVQVSKKFVHDVFVVALIINITYTFASYAFSLFVYTPPEVNYFLSNTYLSYDAAVLCGNFSYLTLVLFPVALFGLCFFKNWARQLFTGLWLTMLLLTPFYTAGYGYGFLSMLGLGNSLIGGFILCLVYFTPAANYFQRDGEHGISH